MSTNNPSPTQNHSKPTTGNSTTYMIVVKGRNARPSNGATNLPKARSTNGVKTHMNSSARRGEATANSAKTHPHPNGTIMNPPAVSHFSKRDCGNGEQLR